PVRRAGMIAWFERVDLVIGHRRKRVAESSLSARGASAGRISRRGWKRHVDLRSLRRRTYRRTGEHIRRGPRARDGRRRSSLTRGDEVWARGGLLLVPSDLSI